MASLFQSLLGVRPAPPTDYIGLQKKDDDLGIKEAQAWVKLHPLPVDKPEKLSLIESEKAQKCAKEIIESLKKIPITSKNLGILQPRLLGFCRWNPIVSDYVKDHFKELIGDRETLNVIRINITIICCHC